MLLVGVLFRMVLRVITVLRSLKYNSGVCSKVYVLVFSQLVLIFLSIKASKQRIEPVFFNIGVCDMRVDK